VTQFLYTKHKLPGRLHRRVTSPSQWERLGGVLSPISVILCTIGLSGSTWDVMWLRRDLTNKCLFLIHKFMCSYTNESTLYCCFIKWCIVFQSMYLGRHPQRWTAGVTLILLIFAPVNTYHLVYRTYWQSIPSNNHIT